MQQYYQSLPCSDSNPLDKVFSGASMWNGIYMARSLMNQETEEVSKVESWNLVWTIHCSTNKQPAKYDRTTCLPTMMQCPCIWTWYGMYTYPFSTNCNKLMVMVNCSNDTIVSSLLSEMRCTFFPFLVFLISSFLLFIPTDPTFSRGARAVGTRLPSVVSSL